MSLTIQNLMNQIGYQQLMAPFAGINNSRIQSALNGTTAATSTSTTSSTPATQPSTTTTPTSTLPAAYDTSANNTFMPMMFSMMSMMMMMMQSLIGTNSASSLVKTTAVAEPAATTTQSASTATATPVETTSNDPIETSAASSPQEDYSDPAVLQARQHELLAGKSPELDTLLDQAAQQDPTSSDIETTYSHISQLWEGVGGSENALKQYFLLEAIRGVDASKQNLLNDETSIDSTAKQENLDAMQTARNEYLQQVTQLNQEAV